jgi:hypothetical protein
MIGVEVLGPAKQSMTWDSYQLLYNALGDQEMVTKAMRDTALRRMANEPPTRLKCHHGQYSSTMSHPVATCPEDHDNSHDQTCTRRRHSLQTKLARTSIRLTTLRSGEPPALYVSRPQTLYKCSRTHSKDSKSPTHFESSTIPFILHSSRASGASL